MALDVDSTFSPQGKPDGSMQTNDDPDCPTCGEGFAPPGDDGADFPSSLTDLQDGETYTDSSGGVYTYDQSIDAWVTQEVIITGTATS